MDKKKAVLRKKGEVQEVTAPPVKVESASAMAARLTKQWQRERGEKPDPRTAWNNLWRQK